MVEMSEIVNILYNVIDKSLVLMDEVGCGISIFDGLLLVWVVVEDLVWICVFILFVIYYFELIVLLESQFVVVNVYLNVIEYNECIVFLYYVLLGLVSQSYGFVVVQLVGVLVLVIQCVCEYFKCLEIISLLYEMLSQQSGKFVLLMQSDLFVSLLYLVIDELLRINFDDISLW